MIRALLYVSAIVAAAVGLSWLADRPGELVVNWQGYEIQTSVFRAIVMAALLAVGAVVVWSVVRQILTSPATVGHFFHRRRQERGLEALSAGLIAVGSGDRALATRFAGLAHKSMPHEPLTHLLRAQAAQLSGDRATARRIYESMRNNPETELLGLRGLYLEAQQEKEPEAARQYAQRAVSLNPRLGWSVESLFAMQCKDNDWQGALETLGKAVKNGQIDKRIAARRRAVLLTAQAIEAEETDAARALALAVEAHGLSPDLVPAAAVAGRLLASQGATPRAAKILQRTWRRSPHPDIAMAYAFARIGDSPRDRLARVKGLAQLTPHSDEGQIAAAIAAMDAQEWEVARGALQHLIVGKPSQRVCTLMARIEDGQYGDTGKVREWLARAVHAVRDPVWIADGHISRKWAATSPVTGALDAYVWQQPADSLDRTDTELLIEQLVPAKTGQAMRDDLDEARSSAIEVIEVAAQAGPASARQPSAMAGNPAAAVAADHGSAFSDKGPLPAAPAPSAPAHGTAVEFQRRTASAASASEPTRASVLPRSASEGQGSRVSAPLRHAGSTAQTAQNVAVGASTSMLPATDAGAVDSPSAATDKSAVETAISRSGADSSAGVVARAAVNGSSAVTRMQAPVDRSASANAIDPLRTGHAPDDPGPDVGGSDIGDPDEAPGPITRFRVPPAKGPH